MTNGIIRELLQKYVSDSLSAEEAHRLQQLLHEEAGSKVETELRNMFLEGAHDLPESLDWKERLRHSVLQRIRTEDDKYHGKQRKLSKSHWMGYAAIFILAAFGLYLMSNNRAASPEIAKTYKGEPSEIKHRGDIASLTLADGTVVALDSTRQGILAQQGTVRLTASGGGMLAYKANTLSSGELLMNTLHTPSGGQYKLELSDGTMVWLNAASSLRFPASFSGSQRSVELTGEAYFEVAKNKNKPFVVSTPTVKIQVLGTRFNVKEYDTEQQARTTLCEGSIKISQGNSTELLIPGQQAVSQSGNLSILKNVNMEQALAWKNGIFYFDGADLRAIMQEIERWYDIKVIYPKQPPEFKFRGKLPRNLSLAQVLKVLAETEVRYNLKDRNLTILAE